MKLFANVLIVGTLVVFVGCKKTEDYNQENPVLEVQPAIHSEPADEQQQPSKDFSDSQYHKEYKRRQAHEQDALRRLQQSGLRCNIDSLSHGELAEWATQKGLPPLKVIVGISAVLFQTKDEDLIPLTKLTEVTYISCSGSKLTDKGLSYAAGLKKLEVLYVGDTQISDNGLIHLKELSELRELWLRGTRVTDKGINHLKGLSQLETLLLSRTSLSDASLTDLKDMTSLKCLDISSTNVTDAGVRQLTKLTNLKYLNLYDTKATQNGIRELAKAIPKLQINTKAPPIRH